MGRDKRMLMFLHREYKKNRLRQQYVAVPVGFFKPRKDGWYVVSDALKAKKNLRLEKFCRGRWNTRGKEPTFKAWYAKSKGGAKSQEVR